MITLAELPLRILPPQVLAARRPQRMLERQWIVNRAGGWSIVLSGFFEPLFYLLSIRVGFGGLIGDVQDGGKSIPYAEFVAPALFAASAMNGSIYEATNVFWKLKYDKVYDAALATPLTSGDVALGEMLYATIRGTLYSVGLPDHDVRARHDVVGVGRGDDRRRGADLVRLQCLRHGPRHIYEVTRRLRVRAVADAADVPVLRHVLPGVDATATGPGWRSSARSTTGWWCVVA